MGYSIAYRGHGRKYQNIRLRREVKRERISPGAVSRRAPRNVFPENGLDEGSDSGEDRRIGNME